MGQSLAGMGEVLELVLASARAAGETPVEAWALHELGTRQFGLGNPAGAGTDLQRALELRERIGDPAGAAATRQNLAVVQGGPPLLARLSHVSMALLGAIAALLIAGAVATGAAVLDGTPGSTGQAATHLTIVVSGSGRGTVVSGGRTIRCSARCVFEIPEGRRVRLSARPSRSAFSGWRGDCQGDARCSLSMTDDRRVVAAFVRRRLTVAVEGRGRVTSTPAGIDCSARCSARFDRQAVTLVARASASGAGAARATGASAGPAACASAATPASSRASAPRHRCPTR